MSVIVLKLMQRPGSLQREKEVERLYALLLKRNTEMTPSIRSVTSETRYINLIRKTKVHIMYILFYSVQYLNLSQRCYPV